MKKRFSILALVLVFAIGIIFGMGVYAATIGSNIVTYSRTGSSVSTVEGALNELYTKASVGNATAAQILSGKTALVGGSAVTGTMSNTGAVTLTSSQTGTTTINGYVTTINATNVYNAGYAAKTCPSTSCSCGVYNVSNDGHVVERIKNGTNLGRYWLEGGETSTW